MPIYLIILTSLAGLLALALITLFLYFFFSPMLIVKFLRRGMDGQLSFPKDYDEAVRKVELKKDLVYPSEFKQNTYDLYLPKGSEKIPLVLWVHGGVFVAGDKSGVENWAYMLASQGLAFAAMNYSWAPEAHYPSQIIQITQALKEISKNDRVDMSRVCIAGDSAGAHMAAQFSLITTNKDFSKRINIKSPLEAGALKCSLLYCGPYNFKQMINIKNRYLRIFMSRVGWSYMGKKNWQKSPLIDTITPKDFVTADYPPTYITDGNHFSFEGHGKELGEALRQKGVITRERYFEPEAYGQVPHEYQMQLADEKAMLCFEDTISFLDEYGL